MRPEANEGMNETFNERYIWVCFNVSYLLHLFCIYKSHKHSGLFLTNFTFLWFLTFIVTLVKLGIFFKLVKFVYKALYYKSINNNNNNLFTLSYNI